MISISSSCSSICSSNVCCSDHKRHDNFTDIGICPKTGVQPRKLQLSDTNDGDDDSKHGKSSLINVDLSVYKLEKYVSLVPAYYAAVRLQLSNPNPDPDL